MQVENSFERGFRRAYARDRELARDRHRGPVAGLLIGSLIAVWGLTMLLDNLGLGELRQYAHRAWPAFFAIVGVTLLIHRDPGRNRYAFWGTVWMFGAVCAYASQQGWVHVSFWGLLVPMVIVFFGASFVYRAVRGAWPDDRTGLDERRDAAQRHS